MIDVILNSKVLAILFTVIVIVALVAWALDYVQENIVLFIVGIAFPGGLAAWRDWINSKGWMTYVVCGLALLGFIALVLHFITPEQFMIVLGTVSGLGALTIGKAISRVEPGEPKLKELKLAA